MMTTVASFGELVIGSTCVSSPTIVAQPGRTAIDATARANFMTSVRYMGPPRRTASLPHQQWPGYWPLVLHQLAHPARGLDGAAKVEDVHADDVALSPKRGVARQRDELVARISVGE